MTTRPNFVIFLTDDQGYGDLGCMGASDLRTPNIDRLALDGARFTQWYSNSPVCSPSRAALLTGRYPGNAGVRSILAGHRTATGLPATVPSLASVLKDLGYQTACIGKWHLGVAEGSRPGDHGFDEWFGFLAGCVDYYSHIFYWGQGSGHAPVHDLWDNNREVFLNGRYLTSLIAERAVAFLQRAVASGEPFLLYVPFNAPHYPLHAPRRYLDRFRSLPPERRIMAAMLSAVDDAVGTVIRELERLGVLDSTCVLYTSDNGPSREVRNWLDGREEPYRGGTAGRLRGEKFSLFEGGIRVPAVMSWPARIPGGQEVHEAAASFDIVPTFVRAAGGDPERYELDGEDLLPLVTSGGLAPQRDIFWEMGVQTAMRRGRWKLVLRGQEVEGATPQQDVWLSDLDVDGGERYNRAADFPELTEELRATALSWRARIEERWRQEWLPESRGSTALG
ncbi:MAG: sulfatase-like hydrolase/transferase [Chloroflexi bacterium]|nr:sulfatase-like hydrolase/transferase [Chloroflexota bacterium]